VREFFFDDDTFTANLPRAREIAKKLGPPGLTWSCNSRAMKFLLDANLPRSSAPLLRGLGHEVEERSRSSSRRRG
jgi:hypothetical protein